MIFLPFGIDCEPRNNLSSEKKLSIFGATLMKVREVIERLEADGWYLARTKGSHRQFKHPTKLGTVTVPGKLSKDLAIGTLMSIWKQAQLENE